MSAFLPQRPGQTKRRAVVTSKITDRRKGPPVIQSMDVPDSVTEVQAWLDRVYGNYVFVRWDTHL